MSKGVLICTVLLMLGSPCSAQLDPGTNSMGIYFDTLGETNQIHTMVPFERITAYLILVRPTHPTGVTEYACYAEISGMIIGEGWITGCIILDPRNPQLIWCAFPEPVFPQDNVVVLATYSGLVMNPLDVIHFTLWPLPIDSPPYAVDPFYVSGDGTHMSCGVSSGYPYGAPCASINDSSGIIPNDARTWSQIKAIYD